MRDFSLKLGDDHDKNVAVADKLLRRTESFDIIRRDMVLAQTKITFFYIDGFVKSEMLQKLLVYFEGVKDFGDRGPEACRDFAARYAPTVEVDVTDSMDDIVFNVMSGCTVMLCEGFGRNAMLIDMRSYPARGVDEPENDRVMRGSRDGFVETLLFNITLVRRRIRTPALSVKYFCVGDESRTDVAMLYVEGKADARLVCELADKLSSAKTSGLSLGHESMAELLLKKNWWNPFPKMRTTERPDAASAIIEEGGVILFVDNSPEAMIIPTSVFDFLQEADDFYFPPLAGSYRRLVRLFIFLLTAVITPLWYLLLQNAERLPNELAFLVPSEPGSIPIILQLLLTEIMLDGLKLASLNTPNTLSNSLSVVGGLLLGDFAVKVGWLCPDVILYMAFIAIGGFTQSNYELGYAVKFMRMLTLILVFFFGAAGFAIGLIVELLLIMTNKTVAGDRGYMYPLLPFDIKAVGRIFLRLGKRS